MGMGMARKAKGKPAGGPQARCPVCGDKFRTIKGLLEHCREKGHRHG